MAQRRSHIDGRIDAAVDGEMYVRPMGFAKEYGVTGRYYCPCPNGSEPKTISGLPTVRYCDGDGEGSSEAAKWDMEHTYITKDDHWFLYCNKGGRNGWQPRWYNKK